MPIHESRRGQPDLIQNLWPVPNLEFEIKPKEDGRVQVLGKVVVERLIVSSEEFEKARKWFLQQPETLPNGDRAAKLYELARELIKVQNALKPDYKSYP